MAVPGTYGPRRACDCEPWCGLPPCTGCGEGHGGHDHGADVHLCRDCDIEYVLAGMQCATCKRMRYRTDASNIGAWLWGERCECEPGTPSVRQARGGR